ncbi:hypothetical protein CAFE_04250 [Caprobacter fermentans]|uniref:Uncharacterized protein n=1 Tax=Caproicibacter fermentans TaxID=2576756 RepID=A0A6N8HW29_9FIRM|nr:hypothetical protein [Caproicibacter fermentans]MVB09760.1 hypothetical protein [Caproicibacter fermentans]OCN03165.1 hypothetical protein A7X67_13630 [Clostridium sp. W14A]QNK42358.1 hypothetical protein HCR03_09190 [Caproicibacter fermentans]
MTGMEELLACVDQKEVLLTRIFNLARQIEVVCCEPEHPAPTALIQQRQVFLERLKKCADRVSFLIGRMPAPDQERVSGVLSGRVSKQECSEQEQLLRDRETRCRSLLRGALASDAESARQMKKERDRLQKLVNDSRGKGRETSPFSNVTV